MIMDLSSRQRLTAEHIPFVKQRHKIIVQISRLCQAKDMPVITKHPHFDASDRRVSCSPPEPEIAFQPMLAGHGCRKLRLSLKDDPRFQRISPHQPELVERCEQKIVQLANKWILACEVIRNLKLLTGMPFVGRYELSATARTRPKRLRSGA